MSALLFHCFEMCDLPFSPFYFILFEFPLLERKTWLIFVVLWNIYIYIYIYIFFFLKFEIWNLEFETFFLKKDTLCSWSSLKFFFIHPFLFFSLLKEQNKNFIYFFFWELTESTQWNLSWLSNPGEIKGGGGANFLAPHLLHLHLFILLLPPHSSLFLHCHYSHTSSTCIFFLLTQFLL